ncbi:hypothetical protein T05_1675 [Trichinella murrelli]|uniref:Uncharacterized protein n=1 Tax=Trichinella murrelli TaxID=144512 RepID=A0A0V0TUZ1_9BILA|nr:hypothetical protein T05_1675 [Trichinella murrelli]
MKIRGGESANQKERETPLSILVRRRLVTNAPIARWRMCRSLPEGAARYTLLRQSGRLDQVSLLKLR